METIYAGVDLGGTKILTALSDNEGNLLGRHRLNTEAQKGQQKIIENIFRSLSRAAGRGGIELSDLQAVGVGSPGPLDPEEGIVHATSNLPFSDFPLKNMLKEKIDLPVYVDNDANAAALGEYLFGAGQGGGDQIYITVSTGVGGGVIIDGEIYHGSGSGAGEIGHMIINPGGPTCGFGQHRGCLEAMASGTAIAREASRVIETGRAPELKSRLYDACIDPKKAKIPGDLIADAAREGNEALRAVFKEMGFYLGIGAANLISIFNPDRIIFGGGVMEARDLFWEEMLISLGDHALVSSRQECELLEAELGEETGVIGALALALKAENRNGSSS